MKTKLALPLLLMLSMAALLPSANPAILPKKATHDSSPFVSERPHDYDASALSDNGNTEAASPSFKVGVYDGVQYDSDFDVESTAGGVNFLQKLMCGSQFSKYEGLIETVMDKLKKSEMEAETLQRQRDILLVTLVVTLICFYLCRTPTSAKTPSSKNQNATVSAQVDNQTEHRNEPASPRKQEEKEQKRTVLEEAEANYKAEPAAPLTVEEKLLSGMEVQLVANSANPMKKMVSISSDKRLLLWRDVDSKETNSLELSGSAVMNGLKVKGHKDADTKRSFTCYKGRGKDFISFECETIEQKDEWVKALRQIIRQCTMDDCERRKAEFQQKQAEKEQE